MKDSLTDKNERERFKSRDLITSAVLVLLGIALCLSTAEVQAAGPVATKKVSIPPIDAEKPARIETATFALG
jgi:hypothetical protein